MDTDMMLRQGDCLDIMANIPDNYVDMILCDLPYGTTACSWDVIIPFDILWEQYWRIIKPEGVIALFGAEPFSSRLRLSDINYRYDWYWKKNLPSGMAFAKYQPMRVVETISIFSRDKGIYNKQPTETIIADRKIVDGRKNGSGSNGSNHVKMKQVTNIQTTKVNPRNLLDFKCVPNAGGYKLHPTQKPVDLMEYLIKTYTNEGEVVLDNCMGSGTTGIACINTNRKFIGIEKDEKYFNTAEQRIKDHLATTKIQEAAITLMETR